VSARSDVRLSELQISIMRILWEREEATVNEVHEALAPRRRLAPTTVATLLKRLEKRGLLAHRSRGRQFVYRSLRNADEIGRSMVSGLVDSLYDGRAAELFAQLLDTRHITPGDLAKIKRLIAAKEREAL